MRYDNSELSLIKNTFAENFELLYAIRKVMLQMPLNAVEGDMIEKTFKGNIVSTNIIRKSFLPELDGDTPLGQMVDLWMTLDINNKQPFDAFPYITARDLTIRYLDQQLKVLAGEDIRIEIEFDKLKPDSNLVDADCKIYWINLTVRNLIIVHTEQRLLELYSLAGQKTETLDEMMKRLFLDSNK